MNFSVCDPDSSEYISVPLALFCMSPVNSSKHVSPPHFLWKWVNNYLFEVFFFFATPKCKNFCQLSCNRWLFCARVWTQQVHWCAAHISAKKTFLIIWKSETKEINIFMSENWLIITQWRKKLNVFTSLCVLREGKDMSDVIMCGGGHICIHAAKECGSHPSLPTNVD